MVKESFKLYKAVSECVINLADAFFEMEYHDAGGAVVGGLEGMGAGQPGHRVRRSGSVR